MPDSNPFSDSYSESRRRFLDSATKIGATIFSYPINAKGIEDEELCIDVAPIGTPDSHKTVVVTSGLHGVEGFFGSAIQLAWIHTLKTTRLLDDVAVVLVHAINPYGFSWRRRWNIDNIDLNRNYLLPTEEYNGEPPGYRKLNNFLNPASAPQRFELFRLKAIWNIWRRGLQPMKDAVAVGQYEYEKGLFFGGRSPAESTLIIQAEFCNWIGAARNIIHVDLHSGLGKSGDYKLLLIDQKDSPSFLWYSENYGTEFVEPLGGSTSYPARGLMGGWMHHKLRNRDYRYLAAEFGTHSLIRVLGALRAENRAHFHGKSNNAGSKRSKMELMECFCPASNSWRKKVVEKGVFLIDQSISAGKKIE